MLRAARCALRGVWHVRCLACCALHFPVTLWRLDVRPHGHLCGANAPVQAICRASSPATSSVVGITTWVLRILVGSGNHTGPGHLSGIIAGYFVGWKLLNWLDGPWLLVALAVLAHPLSSFPAQRYCL